jgi:hypothetical protein
MYGSAPRLSSKEQDFLEMRVSVLIQDSGSVLALRGSFQRQFGPREIQNSDLERQTIKQQNPAPCESRALCFGSESI